MALFAEKYTELVGRIVLVGSAPLQEIGVPCESYVLEKCGHSPFMEKYAKEEFYGILLRILAAKE